MDNDVLEWIERHAGDDTMKLRLKYNGRLPWLDMALMQIECRRKARKKLSETLQCRSFIFPTRLSEEQCTSDTLAAFHASLINEGEKVADLTCGLGIDAFHIARRASKVTAVERDPVVADAAKENARALGLDNITVVNADCRDFLDSTTERFDTMFIDPARRSDSGERVYRLSDCSPDVCAMLPAIATRSRRLIVKASPMLDITMTLRELPETRRLYVVGSSTECKELVADMDFGTVTYNPEIEVWTPDTRFTFTRDEEAEATPRYAVPEAGGYLYEPGAALMKAAPYRLLSQRFDIGKLNPNTHLYCSHKQVKGFPGDMWHIERVADFASHELKNLARQYPRLNVAVRNFDYTAEWLRKKLKVKDGGPTRLIATTLYDGRKVMLILQPA